MSSTSLVTDKDVPTHRLTLKLEDGSFRTFHLTPAEADWMARNINSVDPFIQLPKSVDPNGPSFYPKRGAWMERMSADEMQARRTRHTAAAAPKENDVERKKRNASISKWIAANPKEYEKLRAESQQRLEQQGGFYKIAKRATREHLARYEAMRAIEAILFPIQPND